MRGSKLKEGDIVRSLHETDENGKPLEGIILRVNRVIIGYFVLWEDDTKGFYLDSDIERQPHPRWLLWLAWIGLSLALIFFVLSFCVSVM